MAAGGANGSVRLTAPCWTTVATRYPPRGLGKKESLLQACTPRANPLSQNGLSKNGYGPPPPPPPPFPLAACARSRK
eukprot:6487135-Pyramimonas_sp.AAC.1